MICNPASEERSPPAKYILICLLLSKVKVFTLLIRAPLGYFLRFDTLILPQNGCSFFIHLIGEKQYSVKI